MWWIEQLSRVWQLRFFFIVQKWLETNGMPASQQYSQKSGTVQHVFKSSQQWCNVIAKIWLYVQYLIIVYCIGEFDCTSNATITRDWPLLIVHQIWTSVSVFWLEQHALWEFVCVCACVCVFCVILSDLVRFDFVSVWPNPKILSKLA